MTSTPSRSRASTRMSRPSMAGPTSARLAAVVRGAAAAADFFFVADSVVLLMALFGCGRVAAGQAKTRDRCQPWVFVEISFSLDKRQRRRLDRKSTRLNSSHGYLSDAV